MADQEGGLRTDLLKAFGEQLDKIYVKLGELDDRLQKMSNREIKIELSRNTIVTARALDELARAFERFRKATPESLTTAAESVGTFMNLLNKTATDVDANQLTDLGKVLRAVSGFFSELDKIAANANSNSTKRITDIITNAIVPLFGIVKDLGNSVKGSAIQGIADLVSSFGAIISAVDKFIQHINGVGKLKNAGNILGTFITLQLVFLAIRGMTRSLSNFNPETLSGAGKLFKGLGEFFESIQKGFSLVKDQSFKSLLTNTLKTILVLVPFLFIVRQLVKSLANLPSANLAGIGDIFQGLGRIFESIKSLTKQVSDIPNILQLIRLVVSMNLLLLPLRSIFGALRQLGGKSVDTKSIGNVLEALGKLMKLLAGQGESKIDAGNFKGVVSLIKDLVKTLNSIKFDKSSAKALESVLNIFQSSSGGSALGGIGSAIETTSDSVTQLSNRSENLSDAISQGFVDATLKIRIFDSVLNGLRNTLNLIGDALRSLNPVAIFSSGLGAVDRFSTAIREIGDNIREAGESLRDFGDNVLQNFGVGNILSSDAFGDAVDFDRIGTQLQVFGGLTDEARIQAEDFANQIGVQYPLSANEALSATLDLLKAGQDLASIESILPAAADLAALSDSGDLNAATETLIAATAGFKEFSTGVEATFSNIGVASDILAAGADVGTASVESLSAGLANVGPAAAAAGLSLDETVAILSIFDENAIEGAEGGTALRSVLDSLGRPQTQNALRGLEQQLGLVSGELSLYNDDGSRRDINEFFNSLQGSLSGLSDQDRSAALQQLADTFGRQGLSILLDQGQDGILNVVNAMEEVAPASERAAGLLDNFAGDVEQLRGSFETLLTSALLPTLERFFRPFVKIARVVVDSFLQLDRSVLAFISSAVTLASIGATLIGGFAIFAGTVLQVGGAVFTVIGILINFGLVISSIVAGVTAFVVGLGAILLIGTALLPIIIGITAVFETLFRIFNSDAGGAKTAAQAFFGTIGSAIGIVLNLFSALGGLIGAGGTFSGRSGIQLQTIGAGIAGFFDGLTEAFDNSRIGNLVKQAERATEVVRSITDVLNLRFQREQNSEAIAGLLTRGLDTEAEAAIDELEHINGRLQEQIGFILNGLFQSSKFFRELVLRNVEVGFGADSTDILNTFVDLFLNNLVAIENAFADLSGVFVTFFQNLMGGMSFGDAFTQLRNDFDTSAAAFIQSILGFVEFLFGPSSLVDSLQENFSSGFFEGIRNLLGVVIDQLREAIIGNRDTLKGLVQTLFGFFFAPLKSIKFFANIFGLEGLSNVVSYFENILRNLVGGIFDTIINLMEGQDLGEALINAFGNGIEPLINLGRAIGNAVGLIGEAIGVLFQSFDLGEDPVGGFLDYINIQIDRLSGFINFISELILEPLSQGDISGAFGNIVDFIGQKLTEFVDFISGIVASIDFAGIGNALLQGIFSGIATAFASLSSLTGIDLSGVAENLISGIQIFIDSNLAAFETGGVGGVFSNTANLIVELLGNAINAAFAGLGDFLNIDLSTVQATLQDSFGGVLDALRNLFTDTDSGDSIFTNIAQTIETIITPIQSLIAVLSTQVDSESVNAAVQGIADFVGRIIGFGIDTVTAIVAGIDTFFERLSELDATQLANLGVVITSIAIAIGVMSGALTTFTASILPALLPLAGFLSAILIIQSVGENMGEVFDIIEAFANLDIAGILQETLDALLNIFASISFSLLDLLGIDVDVTREEIVELGRSLGNQLVEIFQLVKDRVIEFFNFSEEFQRIQDAVTALGLILTVAIGGFAGPVLLFFQGLLENLGEVTQIFGLLLRLDVPGALREILDAFLNIGASIAGNVLDLFGLDGEAIEAEIVRFARTAGNAVLEAFRLIGREIARIAGQAGDQANLVAARGSAGLAVLSPDEAARNGANAFLAVEKAFNENLGTLDIGSVFGESAGGLVAQDELDSFARLNAGVFVNSFTSQLIASSNELGSGFEAFAGETGPAFTNALETALSSGLGPEFFGAIIDSGDLSLLTASIEQSLQFGPGATQAAIQSLQAAFNSGTLSQTDFQMLLGNISLLTTDESVRTAADQLIAQMNTATAESETAVNVPVQPTVQDIAPDAFASFANLGIEVPVDVAPPDAVDTAAIQAGTLALLPQGVEVPITPVAPVAAAEETVDLGLSGAAPEDAAALNEDILLLQTNMRLLIIDIQLIIPQITLLSDGLIVLDTSLQTVDTMIIQVQTSTQLLFTSMTIGLTLLGVTAVTVINLIVLPALNGILLAGTSIGTTFVTNIGLASFAIADFGSKASNTFNAIASGASSAVSSVNNLASAIKSANNVAQSLNTNVNGATASSSGGGAPPPGKAIGGTTLAGGIYEVNENGTEFYEEDGKMFLLASGQGRVFTMEQMGLDFSNAARGMFGTAPQAPASTNVTNTSNMQVTIEGSSVSVTVSGSNLSADDIAKQVIPKVERAIAEQQRSFEDLARTTGR